MRRKPGNIVLEETGHFEHDIFTVLNFENKEISFFARRRHVERLGFKNQIARLG